ncbi:hypothetical protein [Pseudoalteromonas sp. G4]|uniref:hypothetical protein n=1 Tax=Pseudoalteromonas sp. G4 TaxID=2992761 RepID=UPI00237DCBC0|nr:hypothetical protein [Pseudoalteromonas sp. G4]MDE3271318.1 hypothetical protein [Pseudoalteromonas sp. G4]
MLLYNTLKKDVNLTNGTDIKEGDRSKAGKEMPTADNSATFSEQLSTEMPKQTALHTARQYQQKSVYEADKNVSFLAKMQEAILMQRLGVDIEKIKQLKEKIEEIETQLNSGDISQKDANEHIAALEKMIAEEYQKGQERSQLMAQKQDIIEEFE